MWAAKTPNGPSIKLHVQNIHTMDELKLTGNCLKGSRGLLSFDKAFDDTEWGKLTKEVFTHVSPIPFCPSYVVLTYPFPRCLVSHQVHGKQNHLLTTFLRFLFSTTKSGSAISKCVFSLQLI